MLIFKMQNAICVCVFTKPKCVVLFELKHIWVLQTNFTQYYVWIEGTTLKSHTSLNLKKSKLS